MNCVTRSHNTWLWHPGEISGNQNGGPPRSGSRLCREVAWWKAKPPRWGREWRAAPVRWKRFGVSELELWTSLFWRKNKRHPIPKFRRWRLPHWIQKAVSGLFEYWITCVRYDSEERDVGLVSRYASLISLMLMAHCVTASTDCTLIEHKRGRHGWMTASNAPYYRCWWTTNASRLLALTSINRLVTKSRRCSPTMKLLFHEFGHGIHHMLTQE